MSDSAALKSQRVAGLDSIRAICAFWVVMGHIGAPPLLEGLDEANPIAKVVAGIYGNLWSGPAAVIVFFVISGFCIHYPYASDAICSDLCNIDENDRDNGVPH